MQSKFLLTSINIGNLKFFFFYVIIITIGDFEIDSKTIFKIFKLNEHTIKKF